MSGSSKAEKSSAGVLSGHHILLFLKEPEATPGQTGYVTPPQGRHQGEALITSVDSFRTCRRERFNFQLPLDICAFHPAPPRVRPGCSLFLLSVISFFQPQLSAHTSSPLMLTPQRQKEELVSINIY